MIENRKLYLYDIINIKLPFQNCVPIGKSLVNIRCKWQIKILSLNI